MTVTAGLAFLGAASLVLLVRSLLHRAIRAGLAAPRLPHAQTPAAFGLAFASVSLPGGNGRRLHGWLIPGDPDPGGPRPGVIVVHGWGGNAGMMLPLAPPLAAAGLVTLFIDARCHGASDDDTFASLPRFAEDVEQALDWLAARPEVDAARIALLGHSVGAGAVLLAATRRPTVAAVVSVAAFAHPATMMRRWLAAKRVPGLLGRYILGIVEQTIGHRFDDIAPIRTIARVNCPVLLVHGQADDVVPLTDAAQILAARGTTWVDLLVVPGNHASYTDLDSQLEPLIRFLRNPPGR